MDVVLEAWEAGKMGYPNGPRCLSPSHLLL